MLVALDGDRAGRDGAVKAWHVLRAVTGKTVAATLPPGCDPAQILQDRGPAALRAMLSEGIRPLADLVTVAWLTRWERVLDSAAGQVAAMRGTAALIAAALPPHTTQQIVQLTRGSRCTPVTRSCGRSRVLSSSRSPALLPPDAVRQICLVAGRLGFGHSDVTAEVADAVSSRRPKTRGRPRRPPPARPRQRPVRQG